MASGLESEIRSLLKSVVREVAQELMGEQDFSGSRDEHDVDPDDRYQRSVQDRLARSLSH